MATMKWQDVRPGLVAELGGEAVVVEAHRRTLSYVNAYRLAKRETTASSEPGKASQGR